MKSPTTIPVFNALPRTGSPAPAHHGIKRIYRSRAGQPPSPLPYRQIAKSEPWLAEALRTRWKSYYARLKKCRKKPSAQSVHELRVATRRLISQLTIVGIIVRGGRTRKAHRILKRQLESLSALRDHHMQQIFFEQQSEMFPGLKNLREHLKNEERKLIKPAARQLNHLKLKKLDRWIEELIANLLQDWSDSHSQDKLISLALRNANDAFAEVVKRRQAIDFSDLRTIHRTRIAFKKFRYIVESLPRSVTGYHQRDLRELADYQRLMGDIQDLVVIQSSVTSLTKNKKRTKLTLTKFNTHLALHRFRALKSFRKSADKLFHFWPLSNSRPSKLTDHP